MLDFFRLTGLFVITALAESSAATCSSCADPASAALAAAAGRCGARGLRLAVDLASERRRPHLCGIWRCLRRSGPGVAMAGGWGHADPLGRLAAPYAWRAWPSLPCSRIRLGLKARTDGGLSAVFLRDGASITPRIAPDHQPRNDQLGRCNGLSAFKNPRAVDVAAADKELRRDDVELSLTSSAHALQLLWQGLAARLGTRSLWRLRGLGQVGVVALSCRLVRLAGTQYPRGFQAASIPSG